jgi:hypothetical protein
MLNLIVILPAWLCSLLIFQWSYVYQTMTQAFYSITPAVIHQTIQTGIEEDEIIVYLQPKETTDYIQSHFYIQKGVLYIPYQFVMTYQDEFDESGCLNRCQGVRIVLTYQLYGTSLTHTLSYTLTYDRY